MIPLGIGLTVLVGGLIGCYQWTQTQYYVGANGDHVALYRGIEQDLAWISLSKVENDHPEIELRYLPPYQRKLVESTIAEGDLPNARRTVQELSVQASACKKESERRKAGSQGGAGGAAATPTPAPSLSEEEQGSVLFLAVGALLAREWRRVWHRAAPYDVQHQARSRTAVQYGNHSTVSSSSARPSP